MAESVLLVKKGWQLIGSSTPLNDMSKFIEENVEQVWHFDAQTQTWLAYSPDNTVQNRMKEQNISELKKLKNWHGFWLKSKKDWTMIFEDKLLDGEPSSSENTDIIELKKGWNLISLPIDSVLSTDIFQGLTAWKYNNNNWELFDENQAQSNFPKLGHIKNSDGIWLKSKEDKNISLNKEASKLHNFKNTTSLEAYIKEMATLNQRPYCGIEPFIFNERNIASFEVIVAEQAENTSTTNLQEHNVDESDILKHNEQYVFYVGKSNGQRSHININSFQG
jgi:hypothetical protein